MTEEEEAPKPPEEEAEDEGPPEMEPLSSDPLTNEFMYYASVLKIIGPLSKETDRKMVIPWIRKLFRPEYHGAMFKEKRNRYLSYLTITLLLDEVSGLFRHEPNEKALADLADLKMPNFPAAEWELDPVWQDTLKSLPTSFKLLSCCVHKTKEECNQDHALDNILDQEFQFILHMVRPYAALLTGQDRTRVAAWLQVLCSIHGVKSHCASMKGIRNDYMMALAAYLNDLRAIGPFSEYPPLKTLESLVTKAKKQSEGMPITDPTSSEANQFLCMQTVPDDGAFCYISITGDMIKNAWDGI